MRLCRYFKPILIIRLLTILPSPFNPHGHHSSEHIFHDKRFEVQVDLPVNCLALLKYIPFEGTLRGCAALLEFEGHELRLVLLVDENEQEGVVMGFQRERELVGVALVEVSGEGEAGAGCPDIRGLVGVQTVDPQA